MILKLSKYSPRRQSHASNNTSLFLASLSLADLLFLLLYVPLDLWRQLDYSVYQVPLLQYDHVIFACYL